MSQELLTRLRFALGDGDAKLSDSQLVRRGYELSQKARKWDDWHEVQNEVEQNMPAGWRVILEMSPGDWDLYLQDPDGERVRFDRDSDTTAQMVRAAIEKAREVAGIAKEGESNHPVQGNDNA